MGQLDRVTSEDPTRARLERLRAALLARSRVMTRCVRGAGAPLAEDLTQACLLRLQAAGARRELPTGEDELRRFALRALHNLYVDVCHRKHRELLAATDEPVGARVAAPGPDPEAALLAAEAFGSRRRALLAALGGLEEQERRFLALCLEQGSAPKAQEVLGWPPGTPQNACTKRNRLIARLQNAVTSGPPTLKDRPRFAEAPREAE